ncbi:hypothetical protein V1289_003180 [Bradyrhizobium sp. AZCC 2289]
MRRSRAPSIAPGTFFVAQPWADCITNMPGFNLRQAQGSSEWYYVGNGTQPGPTTATGIKELLSRKTAPLGARRS